MPLSLYLAWLYWNPPIEVFTVPWINRPVAWYGVLFVLGFILGYFIFATILTTYLKKINFITDLDISNWSKFIQTIQNNYKTPSTVSHQLMQTLNPNIQAELKKIDLKQIDQSLKVTLLQALNQLIKDKKVDKARIKQEFETLSSPERIAYALSDKLLWFIVLGTVIGARLGHVFFYDWDFFRRHPEEIIKIWKGGLASHGGVVGVMIGLYLFYSLSLKNTFSHFSFLRLLDYVAIPSALTACFIRLGNFMNQEIVGTPTQVPWAIVFGNAADGSLPLPRHPVQLYEAFAYLITFFILIGLWKAKKESFNPGFFVGLFFILIFSTRFILEFWKVPQDSFLDLSTLQAGQLLSIPFILLGIILILFSYKNKESS